MCMARVFLLALWMASSAASATRMGSLSLARQPVRPAVLRRPIVLRRTTVLTSSLQDNYQTAPTAPPAPAQAPVPIPPRQLGLPPGSVTPPRCSPTMQYSQYRGQRQGSVEEQDYCHQQGCEQGYEVQQGISRQDLGGKGYGVGPTWAPPASAMSYHLSYKGACEVGPRFTPET